MSQKITGTQVRATTTVSDNCQVVASRGDLGLVMATRTFEDGTVSLTVQWERGRLTTPCLLGVDCDLVRPIAHVKALVEITETNFAGKTVHTHARKGDLGTLLALNDDGIATVRFVHSGTVTNITLGDDAELHSFIAA